MKIVSIVGARPQFIKEAQIQKEIDKHNDITEIVVHTGQHYDVNMSNVFFKSLEMRQPDYNLDINGKSHAEMTALMMIKLEKVFDIEKPDFVNVYGDTNSTLAAAIVASKMNIPIIHIEAGLRQEPHNMPEEINRVLTDRISTLLFSPSYIAVENLKREGISKNVYNVGDVMYDLFKNSLESIIESVSSNREEYCVLTLHRDFNVDDKSTLKNILIELDKLSRQIKIVFPIHPRTRNRVKQFELEKYLANIEVIDPLDYLSLMKLTKNSKFVITDSGGFQKESYFLNKNAYVIMPDTSWTELIKHKINFLVDSSTLIETINSQKNTDFKKGIYGEGDAAKKIIRTVREYYNNECQS